MRKATQRNSIMTNSGMAKNVLNPQRKWSWNL